MPFATAIRAALTRPNEAPAPPELELYLIERAFAERFNVPAPPLRQWPARKVRDYMVIMRVEEQVRAQRSQDGGGPAPAAASSPKPQATEEAFQVLRAQAVPPPMPPPAVT